ncbi:drug resistance transporter, EmrB/QacA subfamily [Lentzea albidocapillata subsp. violacea]|uniref:Drug resistance transporter, EmrB/QacA subfamily n=1 Tax=Lentzea albidocapillata subsp. violacea TaxID=128104 RepID=A0A1G8WID5_9PSEU|nr:MFS transporter [Lentzea albidocapillata]SDJ78099.1 drug resistance transporter, EmrB/QacA subfamily [Lentzea albidocapillata subsp. violacea]
MYALCIGFFMTLLDTTIVNVALPSMITDLNASLNDVIWVVSAYLLAFAVPLLLTGRLGDRYGPKRLYGIGLVLFIGASLACGLSTSAEALITARVFQGLGAAAMTPQTMAFITHLFPPVKRGAALGMWGSVAGLATVSGPLLGGVLVTHLGWEWIFFVNLPIGVLAVVLLFLWVPDLRPDRAPKFDVLGVVLCCLGLGLLVFGIQNGEHYRWGRVAGPVTITEIIAAGVLSLAGFVLWQASSRNPEPLMPLRIFRNRNFSLGNVANIAIGITVTGVFVPLALFLQTVPKLSPLMTGLVTAPASLMSGVVAIFAGRLSNRADAKYLPITGFALMALGIVAMTFLLGDGSQWVLLPSMVALGIGMGLVFSPLTNISTRTLDRSLLGAGSGIYNTSRQFGNVLGSAATAAVLQVVLAATGDFTSAVRAAFYLLLGVLAVGIAAAFAFRRVAAPGVTDSARASDPGLPVTRPS